MLARLLPEHIGILEGVFLVTLLGLTALVGIFSLYVLTQQFRNPGRPGRRLGRLGFDHRPGRSLERLASLLELRDHGAAAATASEAERRPRPSGPSTPHRTLPA